MSNFADDLAAAKAKRKNEPISVLVDVLVNEELVRLKFTELPAERWADICAHSPVRPEVLYDEQYGYNIHSACRMAAPLCGVRVVAGEDVPLEMRRDPSTGRVVGSEWDDLFDVISGHEFGLIADAIWELNEWGPQQRLEAAKKASTLASAVNSPSP
jgi:hypothetical protein